MKRKPQIVYSWRRQPHTDATGSIQSPWRVDWKLIGGNGELMLYCGQGFQDVTDARRSVDACAAALFNAGLEAPSLRTREVGPGRKPK